MNIYSLIIKHKLLAFS